MFVPFFIKQAKEWENIIDSRKREKQKSQAAPTASATGQEPPPRSLPGPHGGSEGGKAQGEPWLEVTSSRYFADWLAQERVSLAFTTYQSGKLFLLGRNERGVL